MIIPIKPWLEMAGQEGAPVRLGGASEGLVLPSDPEAHEMRRRRGPWMVVPAAIMKAERMDFYHEPIFSEEILEALRPVEGKQVFDGTLGGGGHAELLLRHGAHVIGCDQDGAALEHATRRLSGFGDRFLPVRGNFESLDEILAELGVAEVDGVLLDLGVSSRQLDDPKRGFSFREDGPLDMRMDDRSDFSARELVNEWSEEDLVRIFRDYGEERYSRRAAAAVVRARAKRPLETTGELSAVVAGAIPASGVRHPATRVFQAIRIAVNRELECLENALERAVSVLAPGGVLAVVTFHSLEDRIVKQFMRRRSRSRIDRPEWPEPRDNPDYCIHLPVRRAVFPGADEVARNPRARSAKLRVAVRI